MKERLTDLLLRVVVWLHRDSGYLRHLRTEVPTWLTSQKTDPNRWMADGTAQLLAVLSHQGHSGNSVHFMLAFFTRMATFKPWGFLTGDDDEWNEVGPDFWQNRRCSEVFKDETGPYWAFGRVFREPTGACYSSLESRVPITFPWSLPEGPEYVDVSVDNGNG